MMAGGQRKTLVGFPFELDGICWETTNKGSKQGSQPHLAGIGIKSLNPQSCVFRQLSAVLVSSMQDPNQFELDGKTGR